jgi:hypothetical protein
VILGAGEDVPQFKAAAVKYELADHPESLAACTDPRSNVPHSGAFHNMQDTGKIAHVVWDGGAMPNPGPASRGAILVQNKDRGNTTIDEQHYDLATISRRTTRWNSGKSWKHCTSFQSLGSFGFQQIRITSGRVSRVGSTCGSGTAGKTERKELAIAST